MSSRNIFLLFSGPAFNSKSNTHKFGIKLPAGMSLIFDVGQVYYDSKLSNDKKEMINVGIDFGISF